jgi:hypothetical protein
MQVRTIPELKECIGNSENLLKDPVAEPTKVEHSPEETGGRQATDGGRA